MYIKLDATGRVWHHSMDSILPDGMELPVPDGWDGTCPRDWRMEGGVLVHNPQPVQEPPPDPVEQLQAEVADLTLALAELIGTGGGV